MARRRLTPDGNPLDALLVAAFLGDDADKLRALSPAMFRLPSGRDVDLANPYAVDVAWLIEHRRAGSADEAAVLALLREAWPRLRPVVMQEWRKRGRKGEPPGAEVLR